MFNKIKVEVLGITTDYPAVTVILEANEASLVFFMQKKLKGTIKNILVNIHLNDSDETKRINKDTDIDVLEFSKLNDKKLNNLGIQTLQAKELKQIINKTGFIPGNSREEFMTLGQLFRN